MLVGFFNQGRLLYLFYLFYLFYSIKALYLAISYHPLSFFLSTCFVICMCAVLCCPVLSVLCLSYCCGGCISFGLKGDHVCVDCMDGMEWDRWEWIP